MTFKKSISIRENALRKRIDRVLAKRGERLEADRTTGLYYVVDVSMNAVVGGPATLKALADELSVLKPHEVIE